MTTIVKRSSESRIELFDGNGRLIGTISRPIDAEVLGPGREKVYLARRPLPRSDRPSRDHAA
ncbi:MAG TPA: hypothetical protein PK788_12445 [Gemmatimonadaceae bacterium]|nr:hypothetical protein [Gemmatimonadaceae bacterium]HRQ79325.1 hypothetical protein [Gemmatimonadaceae bacterium]